jgi:uncharacterized protein (TIGR00106 family)
MSEDTLIEFSVVPLGVAGSLGPHVARVTRVVQRSGLPNELHSMGTLVEGDLDRCLEVVKASIRELLKDSPRVSASVKLDVRPGHTGRLRGKVASVERHLRDGK